MAEDAPVEIDEAQETGPDTDGEDHGHGSERAVLPLPDRHLNRSSRVGEDVPEQEDENAGREGVQKPLHGFGQAVHAGDGQAQEHGPARDGAKCDGGGLAHSASIGLVRTKDAVRSV